MQILFHVITTKLLIGSSNYCTVNETCKDNQSFFNHSQKKNQRKLFQ